MKIRKSMPTLSNPNQKVLDTLALIEAEKPFENKIWSNKSRPNEFTDNFLSFEATVEETESCFVCSYHPKGVPSNLHPVKAFHKKSLTHLEDIGKFFDKLRISNPMEVAKPV